MDAYTTDTSILDCPEFGICSFSDKPQLRQPHEVKEERLREAHPATLISIKKPRLAFLQVSDDYEATK
jgi:hypothetical protein